MGRWPFRPEAEQDDVAGLRLGTGPRHEMPLGRLKETLAPVMEEGKIIDPVPAPGQVRDYVLSQLPGRSLDEVE